MNIWALYMTEGSEGMGSLASAIQAQAAAARATDVSIIGTSVINSGIMNMGAITARYGWGFSQINSTTVWLWAVVP